jgi:hypothetical protein
MSRLNLREVFAQRMWCARKSEACHSIDHQKGIGAIDGSRPLTSEFAAFVSFTIEKKLCDSASLTVSLSATFGCRNPSIS